MNLMFLLSVLSLNNWLKMDLRNMTVKNCRALMSSSSLPIHHEQTAARQLQIIINNEADTRFPDSPSAG